MKSGVLVSRWTSKSSAAAFVAALHIVLFALLLQTRHVSIPLAEEPIEVKFVQAEIMARHEVPPQPPVSVVTPPMVIAPVPEVSVESTPTAIHASPPPVTEPVVATAITEDSQAPISISEVEYLREPELRYPPASRKLREQGVVTLRVLVDEEGRATQIDVERSSGFPRLDDAARRALREAHFKPYRYRGRSRAALVMVPVEFSLRT